MIRKYLVRDATKHVNFFVRYVQARCNIYNRLQAGCRNFSSSVSTKQDGPQVCIIGSGPAGFYTAQHILKLHKSVQVDIYEKLPVPFGLARFGIAPDHPDTKNCINHFTDTANSGRCSFIGNVAIGKDLKTKELLDVYDAVVLCYGADNDKTFGIPGENLHGVYPARAFVGWYNGLPENADLDPDLSEETAVILGHGNVALDVARILLSPVKLLETTDICEHALEALRKSRVKTVYLVGRRGPMQVAFTIKELRELVKLQGCKAEFDAADFEPVKEQLPNVARSRKRLMELLCKTAFEPSTKEGTKSWSLKFLRSPLEILAHSESSRVAGIKLAINEIKENDKGVVVAQATGKEEIVPCGLVFRSIGYKSVPVGDDVPFDSKRGVIPNLNGRVINEHNDGTTSVIPGLYCSGWVRQGPVGVIASTMNDAFEVGAIVVKDINSGQVTARNNVRGFTAIEKLFQERGQVTARNNVRGFTAIEKLLQERGVKPVFFTDWDRIDKVEQERGAEKQKPREKIVKVEEMMDIVDSTDR